MGLEQRALKGYLIHAHLLRQGVRASFLYTGCVQAISGLIERLGESPSGQGLDAINPVHVTIAGYSIGTIRQTDILLCCYLHQNLHQVRKKG